MTDRMVYQVLEQIGIPRDGVLLMHSSFKTLAREGHDARAVLQTFIDYMEPGTLLLPTMSWRYVKPESPMFDELRTPSNTGILTELFRTEYASARSLHPTHSVAGRGKLAEDLLSGHHLDDTPCSRRSPFGLLARHDGWVLMLGISMDCCTLIHHVEETVAPDIYLKSRAERETYNCRARDGREVIVHLRRHLLLPRDYWQFQDVLASRGEFRSGRIDNTVCRAFRASDMVRAVTDALNVRPDAIIASPGQRYRMM
ncbi:MAG TPA: AAC(3) family N-acetyltransferase [Nitrospirales bacterium]|jgi:aminoglycoside 3-N-acetyltransferase